MSVAAQQPEGEGLGILTANHSKYTNPLSLPSPLCGKREAPNAFGGEGTRRLQAEIRPDLGSNARNDARAVILLDTDAAVDALDIRGQTPKPRMKDKQKEIRGMVVKKPGF